MNLSKSLYTRGLQCQKSLWLKKKNKYVLSAPDSSAEAIFETGGRVGSLACELFPNGKEIPYEGTTFEEKLKLTQEWLDQGIKNIYEASFSCNGIFVMVDILHVNDDRSFTTYEAKSSTEVKEIYLHDVSIQYYVLNGLGHNVKTTNIVHINNEYVREEELDINKLFCITNVTDEIQELQKNIPQLLNNFEKTLEEDNEPDIDIGEHCSSPYECDAIEYCWKVQNKIPDYSVFNISRLSKKRKFEFYQRGILNIEDIPDNEEFSIKQMVQIQSDKTDSTIINKDGIREFLETLTYPIYHLDFETFQQAIPKWIGIKPYMQIPFQYSLHIEHKDGIKEHKEFLAKEGIDPRYELAKKLVNDIPTYVTVLAYNMGFEKGVIKKLAHNFPDLSDKLMAIHENIKDLMLPFQNKDYYTPSMRGSYSIKYVLPALVPDMANAYKELEFIQNGGDAMQTYPRLSNIEDNEEVKKLRSALLEYCKLDTLAMVKVLEKLKGSVR